MTLLQHSICAKNMFLGLWFVTQIFLARLKCFTCPTFPPPGSQSLIIPLVWHKTSNLCGNFIFKSILTVHSLVSLPMEERRLPANLCESHLAPGQRCGRVFLELGLQLRRHGSDPVLTQFPVLASRGCTVTRQLDAAGGARGENLNGRPKAYLKPFAFGTPPYF